jgi:hypothetical protein
LSAIIETPSQLDTLADAKERALHFAQTAGPIIQHFLKTRHLLSTSGLQSEQFKMARLLITKEKDDLQNSEILKWKHHNNPSYRPNSIGAVRATES